MWGDHEERNLPYFGSGRYNTRTLLSKKPDEKIPSLGSHFFFFSVQWMNLLIFRKDPYWAFCVADETWVSVTG